MNDAALFASRLAEANAAPSFRQDATPEVLQPVVQSRMSPEAREDAIIRAHELVQYFEAEKALYEAMRARSTIFFHRSDADRAESNWRRAVDILASLIARRHS